LDRIINIGEPETNSLLDKCLTATIDQDAWNKIRAFEMTPLARKIATLTLDGMGQDLPTAREKAWGLLNAATETFDHASKRSSSEQVSSAMFQDFGKQKGDALLLASAIANTYAVQ
jgi:hypothetical protein